VLEFMEARPGADLPIELDSTEPADAPVPPLRQPAERARRRRETAASDAVRGANGPRGDRFLDCGAPARALQARRPNSGSSEEQHTCKSR